MRAVGAHCGWRAQVLNGSIIGNVSPAFARLLVLVPWLVGSIRTVDGFGEITSTFAGSERQVRLGIRFGF